MANPLVVSGVWRWIKPTWTRAYVLAMSSPGFYFIWRLLDRSTAKALILAMLLGWIAFVFHIWFWEAKPKRP